MMKTRLKDGEKQRRTPLEAQGRHVVEACSGFTLIEVLVASAILALLLVVFLSMSEYASRAWKGSQEKMEEFSTARTVMNRMQADFGGILIRPDLPLFPANTNFGFMTMSRGVTNSADVRPLSYVEYYTNGNNQLIRASRAYTFASSDQPPFSTNNAYGNHDTNSASTLADGVIGFQTAFLNKDGSWSTNYSSASSVGVRVSLLLVSQERMNNIRKANQTPPVLPYTFSTNASNSPEADWNAGISGLGDQKTKASLRAFERLFFLPNAN